MSTLISVITEIMRYKDLKGIELVSLAHGPVYFKGLVGNERIETTFNDNIYSFDSMGRLFETGTCLLYPPKEYKNWTEYKKACVEDYFNSLLRSGDVCLVKKSDMDDWSLAIYQGKWDQGFSAKQCKDPEVFKYCIPYLKNEGMLGRAMFPDWMLSENEE